MPQVTARDLVRFLKSQGFVEERQAGSHLTLWVGDYLALR
jgi:predicted RNA binding protein YcfA (HicA-like mRNA interferase family)